VVTLGVDPLKLTIYTMALNAMLLPVVALPFLLLMNDGRLMRDKANGVFANVATVGITIIAIVLFVVSIPLLLKGGG
jgi:Mn2+/Fe2+ NRAMP family transporter